METVSLYTWMNSLPESVRWQGNQEQGSFMVLARNEEDAISSAVDFFLGRRYNHLALPERTSRIEADCASLTKELAESMGEHYTWSPDLRGITIMPFVQHVRAGLDTAFVGELYSQIQEG